jgi:hypothetical protein
MARVTVVQAKPAVPPPMEMTLVVSEAEAIALVNVLGQNSPAKSGQDIYSVFVALDSALDNNWLSPHIPKP